MRNPYCSEAAQYLMAMRAARLPSMYHEKMRIAVQAFELIIEHLNERQMKQSVEYSRLALYDARGSMPRISCLKYGGNRLILTISAAQDDQGKRPLH